MQVSLSPKERKKIGILTKKFQRKNPGFVKRLSCLTLSYKGFDVTDICNILDVHYNTVYRWIITYHQEGLKGLMDKPKEGRPVILEESNRKKIEALVKEEPRQLKRVLALLEQKYGIKCSLDTLKRFLKKGEYSYRRTRKSLNEKKDKKDFNKKKRELKELKKQELAGEIELYFYDEMRCSLTSEVPYAWQKKGETIEIPCSKSSGINILGFLRCDNTFFSMKVDKGTVDSQVVIETFDSFISQLKGDIKRVIVIDNAPCHTSAKFLAKTKEWEQKNVVIFNLSAYSPELNIIEILWKHIKYYWLPIKAYKSMRGLKWHLTHTIKDIGTKFTISFA